MEEDRKVDSFRSVYVLLEWEFCILCMIRRMRHWRWAVLKPQTQQPSPRTTYPWVRWTRPQCSPSSEKRYLIVVDAHSSIWARRRSDLLFRLILSGNQIITKEIEVNEWKRKYEESRAEVFEMRYDCSVFHSWVNYCDYGQKREYKNILNVSEVVCFSCHPYRKIVAEYEKTVAQMIGELVPSSGHSLQRR